MYLIICLEFLSPSSFIPPQNVVYFLMLPFLVHKIFTFYIFSQQIHLIICLEFLSPSSFIPPQNVVYFLMLPFLVHKIFTFYINGVLNYKYPASGPKG